MSDGRGADERWAPAAKRVRGLDRSSFQSALMQITGAADARHGDDEDDEDDEDAIDSGCSSQEAMRRRDDDNEGVDGSSSSSSEEEGAEDEGPEGEKDDDDNEEEDEEEEEEPLVRRSWENLRQALLVRHDSVADEEDTCEPIEDCEAPRRAGVLVASTQDCDRDTQPHRPDRSVFAAAPVEPEPEPPAPPLRKDDDSSVADLLDDSLDDTYTERQAPAPTTTHHTTAPEPRPTLLDTLKSMQAQAQAQAQAQQEPLQSPGRGRATPVRRARVPTPRSSTGSRWLRDIDAWQARDAEAATPLRRRAGTRFVAGGLAQRYHRLAFQPRTFRPPALCDRTAPVTVRALRAHTPLRQGGRLAALCCCTASTAPAAAAAAAGAGAPAAGACIDVFFALAPDADADTVLAALRTHGAVLTAWYPVSAPCACLLCAQWALCPASSPAPPLPDGITEAAETPLSRIVGRTPSQLLQLQPADVTAKSEVLAGVVAAVCVCGRRAGACETWARPALAATLWLFTGAFCTVLVPRAALAQPGVGTLLDAGAVVALHGVHRAGCRTVAPAEHAACARLGAAFRATRAVPCYEAAPGPALAVRTVPLPATARCYPVACPALSPEQVHEHTDNDTDAPSRVALRGTLVAVAAGVLVLAHALGPGPALVAVAAPARVAHALRQHRLPARVALTDVRCDAGLLALDAYSLVTAETDLPPNCSSSSTSSIRVSGGVCWVPCTSTEMAATTASAGATTGLRWEPEETDGAEGLLARTSRVVALAGRVVAVRRGAGRPRCPACLRAALCFGDGHACERCGTTFRRAAVRTVLTVCPAHGSAALPPVAVTVLGVPATTRVPVRDTAAAGRPVPTPLSALAPGMLVAALPVVVQAVSETLVEARHVPLHRPLDDDDDESDDDVDEGEEEESTG